MAAGGGLYGRIELTGIAMAIVGLMALETAVDRKPSDLYLPTVALWRREVNQLPGPVSNQRSRCPIDTLDICLESEDRALAMDDVSLLPDPLADPAVDRGMEIGITTIEAFADLSMIIAEAVGMERNRQTVELVKRERWLRQGLTICHNLSRQTIRFGVETARTKSHLLL